MSVNIDNNGLEYDPWSEDEDDTLEVEDVGPVGRECAKGFDPAVLVKS